MFREASKEAALLVASMMFTAVLVAGLAAAVGGPTVADPAPPVSPTASAPKDYILLTAKAHGQSVRGVAWSPDSSEFAVGDDAGAVSIYDSASGALLKTYSAHTSAIKAISWSRDGSLLATGSRDDTVKLWSTADWAMKSEIKGVFDADIVDLAWSPRLPAQGQALELIVASESGQVKRFNDKGAILNNLSVDNPGSAKGIALAWQPQGDLITGIVTDDVDYTVYTWFATSGNKLKTVTYGKKAFDVKWGGPDLIAIAFETGNVSFLDPSTLAEKANVSIGARALSVAWAPKGASGQLNNLAAGGDDGKVRVIDSALGAVVGTLSGSAQMLNLEFSPNGTGTKLLTASQGGVAAVWGDPAPSVVWSRPEKGNRNVSTDVEPVLKFDRPMDDATLKTSISISAVGAVSVVIDSASNNTIAKIVPATKLESDKDYTLTVSKDARSHLDIGNVAMGADTVITFHTLPTTTPGLNIPWLYVGAGIGGLFLIILLVVLVRRRRSGPSQPREVRVGKRGGGGRKGDDWES